MTLHSRGIQPGKTCMRRLPMIRGLAMRVRTFALVSASIALTACGTDEFGPTAFGPNQPTGRIGLVHAISGTRPVNVTVDGVPLGVNLAYAAAAPAPPTLYYPAYVGARQFAVRRTADTTVRLLDQAVTIAVNTDHTVIAVGTTLITTMVLADNNTAPAAGNVKLHAVNATSASNVDVYITAPSADILTITPTIAGLGPRTASTYVERAAGA